jgi:hypothetical protein
MKIKDFNLLKNKITAQKAVGSEHAVADEAKFVVLVS